MSANILFGRSLVIATFCKTQAQFTYGMSPTNTGDLKVPASH